MSLIDMMQKQLSENTKKLKEISKKMDKQEIILKNEERIIRLKKKSELEEDSIIKL